MNTPAFTALIGALACAGLLCLPTAALAQPADEPGPETPADGRPPQPLWEAGLAAFGAQSPAYPGARQRTRNAIAVPYLLYRGRVLRAEQGIVGVRAARTERMELDVGFAGSFGSAASDNDARRGLPNIGTLVEFGPRLRWRLGPAFGGNLGVAVPLRGVFDLSNRFEYRGMALEPSLRWSRRAAGFDIGGSLGLLIADERLADTFYGVAPAFATATRPAYEAQAGLVATRLSFNLSRRLGRDWVVFGFARVDSVRGAANESSPLVGKTRGTAVGLGVSWTFARSDRPAQT
jgi:outer membrane scaffolding protein for murein synthesis (MipA/OmpV family)